MTLKEFVQFTDRLTGYATCPGGSEAEYPELYADLKEHYEQYMAMNTGRNACVCIEVDYPRSGGEMYGGDDRMDAIEKGINLGQKWPKGVVFSKFHDNAGNYILSVWVEEACTAQDPIGKGEKLKPDLTTYING